MHLFRVLCALLALATALPAKSQSELNEQSAVLAQAAIGIRQNAIATQLVSDQLRADMLAGHLANGSHAQPFAQLLRALRQHQSALAQNAAFAQALDNLNAQLDTYIAALPKDSPARLRATSMLIDINGIGQHRKDLLVDVSHLIANVEAAADMVGLAIQSNAPGRLQIQASLALNRTDAHLATVMDWLDMASTRMDASTLP